MFTIHGRDDEGEAEERGGKNMVEGDSAIVCKFPNKELEYNEGRFSMMEARNGALMNREVGCRRKKIDSVQKKKRKKRRRKKATPLENQWATSAYADVLKLTESDDASCTA